MSRGTFIALEGIDGSGKSTQLRLLQEYLSANSIACKHLHFPRLEAPPFGTMIAQFLRGEYGDLEQVHPRLVALLYAEDRNDFAPVLREWLEGGYVVIVDRYVFSNIAFQCAKARTAEEKEILKKWILDLEFRYFSIPCPDLTLYLDLTTTSARSAIEGDDDRAQRGYLEGAADIHESDLSFQDAVRAMYVSLAHSQKDVISIPCQDADGIRLSPGDVHEGILEVLRTNNII